MRVDGSQTPINSSQNIAKHNPIVVNVGQGGGDIITDVSRPFNAVGVVIVDITGLIA